MVAHDTGDSTVRPAIAGTSTTYSYPYAPSPDIIRTHQKDAYFTSVLHNHLSTILRALYGARLTQTRATETRTAADLLYLGLTTLIGNRTLGEEYCDVVQVEEGSEDAPSKLPGIRRRAGYVAASVLVPYVMGRLLPVLRRWLRGVLERSIARKRQTQLQQKDGEKQSRKQESPAYPLLFSLQNYLLTHLDTLTSPAPIYALSLATFYFTGAYYHLSKRLFDLRYIFTRQLQPADQRAGYEVLGVLLVLQLSVQGYLHVQETMTASPASTAGLGGEGASRSAETMMPGDIEVPLDPAARDSDNPLLNGTGNATPLSTTSVAKLSRMTHTPMSSQPHIDLSDENTMGWLNGRQARKCTLCLEAMKEPAATTCGHVFCWSCICDWCREKPECPLCRQGCSVQHVLLLRG